MQRNKLALASLAMDLKRVALGYQRGSDKMAARFLKEALKRKAEIDQSSLKPYVKRWLATVEEKGSQSNTQDIAEDMLMYSTIFQNAALDD